MLGQLTGTPHRHGKSLILSVMGVGYLVECGEKLMHEVASQAQITLSIYTHVREDQITLFGMRNWEERELFKILVDVSGVGPRTALAIVDHGIKEAISAVQTADVAFFSSLPRIGKKLAQKIIIELKPKLGSLQELDLTPETLAQSELAEGLRSLGYSDQDVQKALKHIDMDTVSLADGLKQAIKLLSKKNDIHA